MMSKQLAFYMYIGNIGKLKNKNMELSKLLDRIEEEPGRINDIVCLIDEMSSDTLRYEMEVE